MFRITYWQWYGAHVGGWLKGIRHIALSRFGACLAWDVWTLSTSVASLAMVIVSHTGQYITITKVLSFCNICVTYEYYAMFEKE